MLICLLWIEVRVSRIIFSRFLDCGDDQDCRKSFLVAYDRMRKSNMKRANQSAGISGRIVYHALR